MRIVLFLTGIVVLIGIEVTRIYFIMPFPGSQVGEAIDLAYFAHRNSWLFRIIGLGLISYPAFYYIVGSNPYYKWTAASLLSFWVIVCYAFNFRFPAHKIFYQPETVMLLPRSDNKVKDNQLVIGVNINGKARAYPIEIIGYHHQLNDIVDNQPIMITYCTVCRTGRVFSPLVDGNIETFRLVGMDHFNAMFEDATTKSWWRQVNGEAIVGPLKGKKLMEIEAKQMTLSAWIDRYPETLILQPDPKFNDHYKALEKYDEGKMEGKLEGRDSLSWKDKSWVVGVPMGLLAKAYDWNELLRDRVINDRINGIPVLIALEGDSASFHSWVRVAGKDTLQFFHDNSQNLLVDDRKSRWNWKGECVEGAFKGSKLKAIQSYQEFWHSWKTFHPNSEAFGK
jgi:hypothetical protein